MRIAGFGAATLTSCGTRTGAPTSPGASSAASEAQFSQGTGQGEVVNADLLSPKPRKFQCHRAPRAAQVRRVRVTAHAGGRFNLCSRGRVFGTICVTWLRLRD